MQRYEWLYFDLDNTLLDELEKGLISSEALKTKRWRLFVHEMNLDLDPAEINASYFNYLAYNPIYVEGAQSLIQKLHKSYRLALITNGLPELQRPRLELTGLEKYFDPIVISDVIGAAKPDSAFFDYVYEKSGRPSKDQILIIGDTLTSDIRGGINYGIDTCWFNFHGIENKTEYRPTYTISNLAELDKLLVSSYG